MRFCRHYFEEFSIDGFTIYCSALNNDRSHGSDLLSGDPTPDFGLYADYKWRPTWRNELINWPDFGVPKEPFIAIQQIHDAFYRSFNESVEIGCIGGHGRTGTILACMVSEHLDVSSDRAIDIVRDKYCHHAIESSSQEDFIEFYRDIVNRRLMFDEN